LFDPDQQRGRSADRCRNSIVRRQIAPTGRTANKVITREASSAVQRVEPFRAPAFFLV
jgi:hypothetical protein